jgi:hypothetical protein
MAKKMAKKIVSKEYEIKWLEEPEEHDYPAAESYLSLICHKSAVTHLVESLKQAEVTTFKAKDIFRASKLSLLGVSNLHVKKNKQKIQKGIALSPLLLVCDQVNGKVVIADGYHRMCAIYSYDEDASIPCKII